MWRTGALALAALAATGCSIAVSTPTAPAFSIYNDGAHSVEGRFALYIDASAFRDRTWVEDGACAGFELVVADGGRFAESAHTSVAAIVEAVTVVDRPMRGEALADAGFDGMIVMIVRDLETDVGLGSPMFFTSIAAEVLLETRLEVMTPEDRVVGRTVTAQGDAEGETEFDCSGTGATLTDALAEAMERVLELTGDVLIDAPELRDRDQTARL